MRFAALGSGSRGNALVVEAGRTRVLLDCGFGPRELQRRLARVGLLPEEISAVLVTHEHSDHAGGVLACARRHGWKVYATYGTWVAGLRSADDLDLQLITDARFAIGDVDVLPFPVPHDAREPLQYAFSDGARKLGVLTDVGEATAHVCASLSACDALVLECNHDEDMLKAGPYPPALKARIASRYGHLANSAAAGLLAQLGGTRLQHLIAAHLSEHNNRPELARAALAGALGCDDEWIGVASQDDGFAWRALD